ncbi:MAG TPA: beta-propeller fold lactonase family protein [Anaerolineae bacterium]
MLKRMLRVGIGSAASASMLIAALATGAAHVAAASDGIGAVYVLSNTVTNNQVLIYQRAVDGTLIANGAALTGGNGNGGGLGSQGALALSANNRWLFAVNADSNEISSFAVTADGLTLVGKFASGGINPISLTNYGGLLYVLNAGAPANITGFTVNENGWLMPLAGSTQPLSTLNPGGAQVSFDPEGVMLAVTEKGTNRIDTYIVNANGIAQAPVVHPSSGTTPFGFAFDNSEHLIVSEAFGGAVNASAASSYNVANGNFAVVSASVPTYQTAACWLVVSKNGRYAYTANAGSGSISGYAIDANGGLTLLNANGITALTGAPNSHPSDMSISRNGQFLFSLNNTAHTITGFKIGADGSLTSVTLVANLPASAVGLAAY